MKILEDNLKSTKSELTDLTKCFNALQMDRDAKIKEVSSRTKHSRFFEITCSFYRLLIYKEQ